MDVSFHKFHQLAFLVLAHIRFVSLDEREQTLAFQDAEFARVETKLQEAVNYNIKYTIRQRVLFVQEELQKGMLFAPE